MSVMAGVSDTVIANRDKLRGKIEQTKVKRYWPGKAPEWADDADEEGDTRVARAVALEKAFPSHRGDYSNFVGKDDPRLRRLAECRIDHRDETRGADRRLTRQAEIVSTVEEEVAQEAEDEDTLGERRRRIREKLLQREQEETAPVLAEEEEEEEDELEEYETDSDSEQEEHMETAISVQLVYVPKSERGTTAERELLKVEERAMEEAEKRKLEARKAETKQLVVEKIREDKEKINQTGLIEANVDSDDETNEAEEYEVWKAREMARIKTERDLNVETKNKNDEVNDEKKNNLKPKPSGATNKRKGDNKSMQKYYHKGAFFQSKSDWPAAIGAAEDIGTIFDRDFSAPTGDDKMDKTPLPKIMQVKNFGRRGRTKWTHLLNEDTTDWNNPWTYNDSVRAKYNAKMAAMNAFLGGQKEARS